MSLHINFTLSPSDLEYFSGVMAQARDKAKNISQQQTISNAEQLQLVEQREFKGLKVMKFAVVNHH